MCVLKTHNFISNLFCWSRRADYIFCQYFNGLPRKCVGLQQASKTCCTQCRHSAYVILSLVKYIAISLYVNFKDLFLKGQVCLSVRFTREFTLVITGTWTQNNFPLRTRTPGLTVLNASLQCKSKNCISSNIIFFAANAYTPHGDCQFCLLLYLLLAYPLYPPYTYIRTHTHTYIDSMHMDDWGETAAKQINIYIYKKKKRKWKTTLKLYVKYIPIGWIE